MDRKIVCTRQGVRLAALAASALLAALLAFAPPASAGRPPLGNYNCYLDGDASAYTLSFRLKTKTRYKTPDGKGRYKYSRRSKRLAFKSGPFKRFGWHGKHRHLRGGGEPVIELRGRTNGHRFLLQCLPGRLN